MSQKPWVLSWEKFIQMWGLGEFRLIHDGQRNPGQFEFPPDQVKFYTKTYQWFLDGKPVKTFVKFKYDLREGEATMIVTFHNPREKTEREEMVLRNAKEVLNGKHIG